MFWYLNSLNGEKSVYLFETEEYTIGRKNANIVVDNDASISRKHAILKAGINSVTVLDCNSKYGTWVNDSKVSPNSEVTLKPNDVVKFGIYDSKFRFEVIKIVTTASALNDTQKSVLKNKINNLNMNGSVLSNWHDSCTYLTTEEILLTMKVLYAVIEHKPIVNLEFWDQYLENVVNKKPPPDPKYFRPKVGDPIGSDMNLMPNENRKLLFKNCIFVFTTENEKLKYKNLIIKTGGSALSWETTPVTLSQIEASDHQYIFILDETGKNITDPNLNGIYQHLKYIGERKIPVQELAKAILNCSMESDCNPKFKRSETVFQALPQIAKTEPYSLAADTPAYDTESSEVKQEWTILPSFDQELNIARDTLKRSASDVNSAFKKSKPSTSKNIESNEVVNMSITHKRKVDLSLFMDNNVRPKRSRPEDQDNPFNMLHVKEELNDLDNPFLRDSIIDNPSSLNTSTVDTDVIEPKIATITSIRDDYIPNNSRIEWISTITNVSNLSTTSQELDPDLQALYDKFKDSIVIETIPSSFLNLRGKNRTVTATESGGNGRNFKKFKKVVPLHPQTTIVNTSIRGELSFA